MCKRREGVRWLWPHELKPNLERSLTPITKTVSINERFEDFLADLKESFWGDLEGRTKLAWKHLFETESERLRDRYAVLDSYERGPRQPGQYRNGYDEYRCSNSNRDYDGIVRPKYMGVPQPGLDCGADRSIPPVP